MRFTIKEFLSEAVGPAIGCTEPVAVALAVARARECLGEPVISANVTLSSNVFKNGATVGIPGTNGLKGNALAAAIAMSVGSSSDGLEIFKSVTAADVPTAKKRLEDGRVHIGVNRSRSGVYVLARLHSEKHIADCIIEGGHSKIAEVSKDKNIVYKREEDDGEHVSVSSQIAKMSWNEVLSTLDTLTESDIDFLLKGAKMNLEMAEYGFTHDIGANIGKSLMNCFPDFDKADLALRIKATAAAASDARMGGAQMPVMSSAGSGNHGITAIIPIAVYAADKNIPREKLGKALAISHLATAYIKSRTGGLSTTCGCSFAAGAGSAGGLAWLMSENFECAADAIVLMLGDLVGMLCDGAKESCSLKVGTGAVESYYSALMAWKRNGKATLSPQGIIGKNIDETVFNSMQISNSMGAIEQTILEILQTRETK